VKATRLQFQKRKRFQRSRFVGMKRVAPTPECVYPFHPYWLRVEKRADGVYQHVFPE